MASNSQPTFLTCVLQIMTLWGFAVAQPIYDLCAKHAGFLVAHRARAPELFITVLVLSLLIPAVWGTLVALVLRGAPRLGRWLLWGSIGLLTAVTMAPLLERIALRGDALIVPGAVLLALALVLGAVAAAAYAWLPIARSFLTLMSPAIVIFPALFLLSPSVGKLLSDHVDLAAVGQPVDATAPVVMVVFDEFATNVLMDAALQIDRGRFPHLAAFADQATWYRNATGVHQFTGHAVPATLTGNYPNSQLLPTAADHPFNLFTLLQPSYEVHAFETFTELCPSEAQSEVALREPAASLTRRTSSLLGDMSVIWAHIALPRDWTERLPALDLAWRNFLGPTKDEVLAKGNLAFGSSLDQFRQFVDAIQATDKPSLYFLHVLLPHRPWNYLPSSKLYLPLDRQYLPGYDSQTDLWIDYPYVVHQGWQRYLLQVELVDRLVGELMQKLKEVGIYDQALVVLAADHGVAFWPGQARRDPSRTEHPADIMCVPLLIKAPQQQVGSISDRNVETIDILPTMADLLDVPLPWKVDGESALDESAVPKGAKRIETQVGQRLEFAFPLSDPWASVPVKLELFGSGADPDALYRFGPFPALWGQAVADLPIQSESAARVELDPALNDWSDELGAAFRPALVLGSLEGPVPPNASIAVAVDGIVRGTTPLLAQSESRFAFSVVIPESALKPGPNPIELLLLTGPAEQPTIQRMQGANHVLNVAE
jgi:hypothetical protein